MSAIEASLDDSTEGKGLAPRQTKLVSYCLISTIVLGHISEALYLQMDNKRPRHWVKSNESLWFSFLLFSVMVKTLSDINQEQNTSTALGSPKSLDGLRSDIIYFKI